MIGGIAIVQLAPDVMNSDGCKLNHKRDQQVVQEAVVCMVIPRRKY